MTNSGARRQLARQTDYSVTLDFIPTPADVTQKLLDVEKFEGKIWEPACGNGAISEVLKNNGYDTYSTDVRDYGYQDRLIDFLGVHTYRMDNIITNPPYKLATPFFKESMRQATKKVALLCRVQFLEGQERRGLFKETPPSRIYVFSKRASFKDNMFCHAWFVWDIGFKGNPIIKWLD